MHIDRLDVRLLRLPLAHFFETSFGRSYDRTFLLIRLEGEGHVGWGECVAEAHPYYSSETTETTWHIITSFLAARVVGHDFAHPREVFPALARVRGHNMAKAAVEMAAWDLYARGQGQPLSAVLGGTRDRIVSGVSIGIQDSLDQLVAKVEKELAAGYRRIKIKIKPGWDLNAVEAVRARFPDIQLMVDANAAYSVRDGAHLAKLDAYKLMMIEQPLEYDDIRDHADHLPRLGVERRWTLGGIEHAQPAGRACTDVDQPASAPQLVRHHLDRPRDRFRLRANRLRDLRVLGIHQSNN